MMKAPSVSIIIPVFNTGVYLNKCIDSIVAQSLFDIEIIIVDDGSEKETSSLCDKFKKKDDRIIVYHKKNEGVSVARNYGLCKASGKYIGFVDSDDWIDKDMYSRLFNIASNHNYDIVFCDATTVWDNGRTEIDSWTEFVCSCSIERNCISPVKLVQMAGSVWRGLYSKTILQGVLFPIGLKFSEDRYFNLRAISNSNNIYYCKQSFYNRFMRIGSCVNRYHSDAVTTILKASNLINSLVKEKYGEIFLHPYKVQEVYLFLQCLYGVFQSDLIARNKKTIIKEIASTPELHQLLRELNINDIRFNMIKHKRYLSLYLLLYIHNSIKKYIK